MYSIDTVSVGLWAILKQPLLEQRKKAARLKKSKTMITCGKYANSGEINMTTAVKSVVFIPLLLLSKPLYHYYSFLKEENR